MTNATVWSQTATTARTSIDRALGVDRVERDPTRVDADDHPGLQGALLDRVDPAVVADMSRVLSRELIDVGDRACGDQLGAASNLEKAGSVGRVHDEQADPWVGEHVPALLALERGVDPGVYAVVIDPDQARLG